MTTPQGSEPPSNREWRAPRTLWLRPLAVTAGGLAIAALFAAMGEWIPVVAIAAFAVFMGYWTSPLRSGPHAPLADALARRGDRTTIIVWVPGNPLSARLQAMIRTSEDGVFWVNALMDPPAAQLADEHGGKDALPLVIVGSETRTAVTVGELRDMQARGRERADGAD